jgi:hypothetical protein
VPLDHCLDTIGPDAGYCPPRSARRVNRFLVAGVITAIAGLVSVHPSSSTPSSVQDMSVRLTGDGTPAVDDPAAVWSQVITTAEHNLAVLDDHIQATTIPALTQFGDIQSGYIDTIGTALQNSFDGLQKVIEGDPSDPVRLPGLESMLETVFNDLSNGDSSSAFGAFDVFALEGLKFVVKPLAPILGIPDQMLQDFASAFHALFGTDVVYDTLKDVDEALQSPEIGVFFQLSDASDAISSSLSSGDIQGAVTELLNLPAELTNALLNGYQHPGEDEPFAGLLADGGLLDYTLVQLPQQIAEALGTSADSEMVADLL